MRVRIRFFFEGGLFWVYEFYKCVKSRADCWVGQRVNCANQMLLCVFKCVGVCMYVERCIFMFILFMAEYVISFYFILLLLFRTTDLIKIAYRRIRKRACIQITGFILLLVLNIDFYRFQFSIVWWLVSIMFQLNMLHVFLFVLSKSAFCCGYLVFILFISLAFSIFLIASVDDLLSVMLIVLNRLIYLFVFCFIWFLCISNRIKLCFYCCGCCCFYFHFVVAVVVCVCVCECLIFIFGFWTAGLIIMVVFCRFDGRTKTN